MTFSTYAYTLAMQHGIPESLVFMSGGDEIVDKQPTELVADGDRDVRTAQEEASQGLLADAYDWAKENPGTATAIGVAAAGIGYLTRGKWMPALSRIMAGPGDDAARAALSRPAAFDASKAGLTTFSEVSAPGLQTWKSALGYADVGLDDAGALIYRGAKAGQFADNVLVVKGTQEASTLFRALSREGLLQRGVWERGAANTAVEFGEVKLPGATRFIFEEGKTINLGAGSRLIDLKNGQFRALTADAAEQVYRGLTMF
jgi:hypothetical protein